jgi:hypothetical protein
MESHAAQPYREPNVDPEISDRQCFQRANTHVGAGSAGHWIKMAGILSPLIIGELVKDADKRWRWIRIASVSTALLSEGMYAHRVQRERAERAVQRCR